jgi:hypothetical protein
LLLARDLRVPEQLQGSNHVYGFSVGNGEQSKGAVDSFDFADVTAYGDIVETSIDFIADFKGQYGHI